MNERELRAGYGKSAARSQGSQGKLQWLQRGEGRGSLSHRGVQPHVALKFQHSLTDQPTK